MSDQISNLQLNLDLISLAERWSINCPADAHEVPSGAGSESDESNEEGRAA